MTILSSISLDTLHPYAHSSSPHYGIWNNMIEPLVEVNYAKREYFGVLAESWQFQGKRWVFKLRKNVRFHDGSPFTAQDVIYSINRMKNDKPSLQKENFRDLRRCRRSMNTPSRLPPRCPTPCFSTDCRTASCSARAPWKPRAAMPGEQKPVGTGPYRFVSWQRDGNLVLTRHDNYWGDKAAVKEIVIRRVKEDAGRVAGLLAGQGDVTNNVPVEETLALRQASARARRKGRRRAHVFSRDERDAQAVRQQDWSAKRSTTPSIRR